MIDAEKSNTFIFLMAESFGFSPGFFTRRIEVGHTHHFTLLFDPC